MTASPLIDYYDTHPINEQEIFAKLQARGDDLDRLTQAQLKDFDQDHYGGTDAVDVLADAAGIDQHSAVLDVCSGMGGPARWLAFTRHCTVSGLDLTGSRVDSARRLTERVGLSQKVQFQQGDATAMPFGDGMFDVIIAQEAWVHIPDKAALIGQCRRVLKRGGRVSFTDIVERAPMLAAEQNQMAQEMQFARIFTPRQYDELLWRSGFEVTVVEDLSERWTQILRSRLRMYLSLRELTVARFGQAHHDHWAQMYGAFVGLYEQGKLGGLRILAHLPANASGTGHWSERR
jgi:sarcosine/dimethylglycine N-methyltransferase